MCKPVSLVKTAATEQSSLANQITPMRLSASCCCLLMLYYDISKKVCGSSVL